MRDLVDTVAEWVFFVAVGLVASAFMTAAFAVAETLDWMWR